MVVERPKILCLGVSYASIGAQLTARGQALDLLDAGTSAEAAIECVVRGILTQMDGRDLARCLATEELCDVDVYCVSQEKGARYRPDRHLDANFNRASFVNVLQNHFQGCQFDQIVLDYYWIPAGWDTDHWNKSFFDKTLIAFAENHLLRSSPTSSDLFNEKYRRGIFLPFCLHCFKAIVTYGAELRKHYNISFLRKDELDCLALWSGTQSIDGLRMQRILGKRLDQEEVYCTFGPRHLKETELGNVAKHDLVELASSLEDFPDIRFIVLEPLLAQQSNGLPLHGKKLSGRFLGLVNPLKVKQGFRFIGAPNLSTQTRSPQPNSITIPTRKRKLRDRDPVFDSRMSPFNSRRLSRLSSTGIVADMESASDMQGNIPWAPSDTITTQLESPVSLETTKTRTPNALAREPSHLSRNVQCRPVASVDSAFASENRVDDPVTRVEAIRSSSRLRTSPSRTPNKIDGDSGCIPRTPYNLRNRSPTGVETDFMVASKKKKMGRLAPQKLFY